MYNDSISNDNNDKYVLVKYKELHYTIGFLFYNNNDKICMHKCIVCTLKFTKYHVGNIDYFLYIINTIQFLDYYSYFWQYRPYTSIESRSRFTYNIHSHKLHTKIFDIDNDWR